MLTKCTKLSVGRVLKIIQQGKQLHLWMPTNSTLNMESPTMEETVLATRKKRPHLIIATCLRKKLLSARLVPSPKIARTTAKFVCNGAVANRVSKHVRRSEIQQKQHHFATDDPRFDCRTTDIAMDCIALHVIADEERRGSIGLHPSAGYDVIDRSDKTTVS